MLSVLDPLVALLHSALVHLSALLPGPHDLRVVLALVLVTLLLRAAMLPLSVKGFRSQKAAKELAPELSRLQRKHSNDRARLAQEIAAAHRRAGINPFAGVGLSLAQAPALMTSYRLVMTATIAGQANVLTTVSLLGTPLSVHWLPALTAAGLVSGPGLLCALLGLALVLVAHQQVRKQTEGPRVLRLMPYGSVAFAAVAPVAFGIYLLTSTTWTLAERTLLPHLA